ncbi:hypothetical protein CLIB1444_01S00980 [[Candida] jaroonii]|uniref:Uncharacterized protein n=1 Tax=[Candida] jaroonii TaxID=467808 RepID=A0ACA9XZW0_9ASCO|nr:hypothetical protein CLIB1444_01S00980 [[Candida] jaroonii]
MTEGKSDNQDQLLQDASTLLMFANVAAKQQQEKKSPSPVGDNISSPNFQPTNNISSSTNLKSPPLVNSGPPSIHQQHAVPPNLSNPSQSPNPIMLQPPRPQFPLTNTYPRPILPTTALPQGGQQFQQGLQPALQPGVVGIGYQYIQPDMQHNVPHMQIQPGVQPVQNLYYPPVQYPRYGPNEHESRSNRSSISETYPKPNLTHRRTSSTGTGISQSPKQPMSPGAFERGIDNETGRRNDNNAKFAAAALAQAADNPLPLLKKEEATIIKTEDDKIDKKDDKKDKKKRKKEPVVEKEKSVKRQTIDVSFKAPNLDDYKVDPDAGIIGCICGIEDDDGLTVQCDVCFRWQHCKCMGFDTDDDVPEEYKCYFCDKDKWGVFDAEICKTNTLLRLEVEEEKEEKKKQQKKRRVDDNQQDKKRKQLIDDFDKTPTDYSQFKPNKENELLEEGMSAENYQSTYYKLRANDYRNHFMQSKFHQIGKEFYEYYETLNDKTQVDVQVMSLKEFKKIKSLPIILPNHNLVTEKDPKPEISIQVKPYSDIQKQKFNGISKSALFIQTLGDNEITVPKGTVVIEYFGVLDLFSYYRDNKLNQYNVWGTTKPKVLKTKLSLKEPLELILDSRFVGNESRFIRKSCSVAANTEIKKYYIPETQSFRFLVVTSKDIVLNEDDKDEELRLLWEWDEAHPILKFDDENFKFDQLNEKEKAIVVNSIDNLLYFTECGCTTTTNTPQNLKTCNIFKIKKAITYLLRSTRKISGITNVNLFKPKEIVPREPKRFEPWTEIMENREKQLSEKLFAKDVVENEELPDNIELKIVSLRKNMLNQKLDVINSSTEQEEVEDDMEDSEGPETVKDEFDSAIPITNELKEKIQKSIESEIKVTPEIKKSISEIKLKLSETNEEVKNLDSLEKSLNFEIKPKEIINKKIEITKSEDKPIVKKKLSFADYKKKSLSKD